MKPVVRTFPRDRWAILSIGISLVSQSLSAQIVDPPRPPSLKTIPVPGPTDLDRFVNDKPSAIALGKALFWDMRTGSDGVTACASCHFNAGADTRSKNQVSPGLNAVHADGSPAPDTRVDFGPNRQLSAFLCASCPIPSTVRLRRLSTATTWSLRKEFLLPCFDRSYRGFRSM